MNYRIVCDDAAGEAIAKALQLVYDPRRARGIGLMQDDKLEAATLFEDWNGPSVICHMWVPGRLIPEYLAALADYGFRQLGVKKMIAPIWSDNARMLRIIEKMGFQQEAVIRDAQPNGDVLLYTLRKEDCRFLSERYGKTYKSTANA